MNPPQQIEARLAKLTTILEDAKAIRQWHNLRVFEHTASPSPNIRFRDNTFLELFDKQAAFTMLWTKTATLVENATLSKGKRNKFQKELKTLYLQFLYLGSDVRVY